MSSVWASAHLSRAWWHVVLVLRIVLGFAFVPSGLKKIMGEPFTAPGNTGIFHEFLHAFHGTGLFYHFVGITQLLAAFLLMTQFFGALGAMIFLPICAGILVLCWGGGAIPTAIVVTAMVLGVFFLLFWDFPLWAGVVRLESGKRQGAGDSDLVRLCREPPRGIELWIWSICGGAIFALYVASCWWAGEIYRPRGVDLQAPGFYILPFLVSLMGIAYLVERRRLPKT
jgi:uncharacterized membrane protein YphA (DoxX/SURF4 family)